MAQHLAATAAATAAAALALSIRFRRRHAPPVCAQPSAEPAIPRALTPASARIWRLYARLWDALMADDPIGATMIGVYDSNHLLADVSLAGRQEFQHTLRTLLTEAEAVRPDCPQERQNYSFLLEMLRLELRRTETFDRHEIPTTHLFGPHLYLPQLASLHPFASEADGEAYLSRMAAFGPQVDAMITAFRRGVANGVTLPRCSVAIMVRQLRNSVVPLDRSPMFVPGKLRAVGVEPQRLSDVLRQVVFPAFDRLRSFMEIEYAPAAREDTGIGETWPGGLGLYDDAIAYYTSLPLTATEVHRMGLQEVERINCEMRDVMASMGFEGSLSEFVQHMKNDPQYQPEDAEEIISTYKALLDEATEIIPHFFGLLPKAPCEVRPIESYREQSAPPAHFYPAAKDGSRPAVFYANTYNPASRPTYTYRAISLHEADPGHNAHLSISQELPNLPRVRQQANSFCTGHIEGWGLYVERLGIEMGFYPCPASNFGRLVTEQMRAVRLVVDTGLHAFGWSREEAIRYFAKHVAMGADDVEAEVDRYLVFPGQALAYKVGEIKLWELRRSAEARLGEAFDLKAFHDTLLGNGILPLTMLEDLVEGWVQEQLL